MGTVTVSAMAGMTLGGCTRTLLFFNEMANVRRLGKRRDWW